MNINDLKQQAKIFESEKNDIEYFGHDNRRELKDKLKFNKIFLLFLYSGFSVFVPSP
jgi:hypothetical protein